MTTTGRWLVVLRGPEEQVLAWGMARDRAQAGLVAYANLRAGEVCSPLRTLELLLGDSQGEEHYDAVTDFPGLSDLAEASVPVTDDLAARAETRSKLEQAGAVADTLCLACGRVHELRPEAPHYRLHQLRAELLGRGIRPLGSG